MCGRGNNDDNTQGVKNPKGITTTPSNSPKDHCEDYKLDSTGCNVTIKGQLLLVLDSINVTFREYFSCFCKVVQARLNNTNVTIEILAGSNQSTCDQPGAQPYVHVDQDLLEKKLTNLLELESQDGYAGMAVILTDDVSTSESSSTLSKDREPFLYFVNVGETKNKSGSCYRQYRYVENTTDINEIGHELENIGCNNTDYMLSNNCLLRSSTVSTTSSAENQGVNMPMIGLAVGGSLVVVLIIVMIWIIKKQGNPNRKPSADSSDKYSGVGGLAISRYSVDRPSFTNEIYNELREDEKRTNDVKTEDNYHHLDLRFVKEDVNSALYDHVTVGLDGNKDLTESG
ncbi:uncharacterized protein [Magallana gigas]|uniref:uncharacterized protein n=1 Tax=Magallana gigas TaxID=29159 RepID=UPI00333FB5B3